MALERKLTVLLAGSLLLAGCSTSQPVSSPADIKPVFKIRNSPLPVPDPRWNPRRLAGKKAPVRTTVTQARAPERPVTSRASAATSHTVRRGETLYGLSRRYGVPVRSLISNNKLRKPYTLTVGQRLAIPVARTHTVKRGETGYSISRQYGVTVSALMKANRLRPPYSLAVGQELKLPGGAAMPSSTSASTSRRTVTATNSKPASRPTGRSVAMPTPPPRSSAGFVWPVQGRIASRFGPREGGLHNDGINILADKGTPVRAADAGVVVYASNALEGYGNLLLVKHSGGWITAYAHNERILVSPGQKVKRGDIVARVGATGGVVSPQLHFEIRKGRQALNPIRYLPGVSG